MDGACVLSVVLEGLAWPHFSPGFRHTPFLLSFFSYVLSRARHLISIFSCLICTFFSISFQCAPKEDGNARDYCLLYLCIRLWTMGFAQEAFAFFIAPLSEAWSTAGCFACLAASKLPSLHKLIHVFPSVNTFPFMHRGVPVQLRVNTCSLQFTLLVHLSYLLTYSFFKIACKTFGRHFLNFPKFIDFLVRQSVRWIWCSAPEQNAISRCALCLAPLQGLQ